MNILLPTYGFYPYSWGGTEVYVSGLAGYLQQLGLSVTVIAGMSPAAFEDHPIFYEDSLLKTVDYLAGSIRVIGVIVKGQTTTEIYKKFRPEWVASWASVLNKIGSGKWDILHMHANTAAIGLSLIKAVKLHSPQIKTVASYHVPISCVKGTLLFSHSMKECAIRPTQNICTACLISSNKNWPMQITAPIASIMPEANMEKLPTSWRLKFLIKQFIEAFHDFDTEIALWHVFSDQVKLVLLLNGIQQQRIFVLRHGVNEAFLYSGLQSVSARTGLTMTVFLYAGRFDKTKGFFTLLDAWTSISESKTKVLWIVGDIQTDEKAVKQKIKSVVERKDIQWLGAKTQKDLASIMQKVHCTIIPSEWVEIGPLVFHEAIGSGSDVIASDIGGCRELATIYKKKSTLFRAGKSSSLSKAILNFNYSNVAYQPTSQNDNYKAVVSHYISLVSSN